MRTTVVYVLVFSAFAYGSPSLVADFNFDELTSNRVYVEPVEGAPKHPGSRIIGGTEVTRNSVPYQVALIVNGDTLCGGSLISHSAVLTAAHCTFSASYVQLLLGAHNISQAAESGRLVVTSTNIHNHENFDYLNVRNDIAIVSLPVQVTLTNAIQLVGLAPANAGTYAGSTGFVTGWGLISDTANSISPVLRGVNLNIIQNAVCQWAFGDYVLESNICASGAGAAGACGGDSGGPIVVDGVQVGIVSFGSVSCEDGTPSVYARVSSFRSWISSIAGV